jgi:hypothetical protein
MLQEVYCFIIFSFIGPHVTAECRKYYYCSHVCMLYKFVSRYNALCLLVCPLISNRLFCVLSDTGEVRD